MPRQGQSKASKKREGWWPCQESLAPVMISTRPAFEFDKAAGGMGQTTNLCGKWKKLDACSAFLLCDKDTGLIAESSGLQISCQFLWLPWSSGVSILRGDAPHIILILILGFCLSDDAMCGCLIAILFGSSSW